MILDINRPSRNLTQRGGVWDYVSASRLNLWLKCPLAFKLRYIDGVPSPPTPGLFIGKQCHRALEHWYRQRQLGEPVTVEDVLTRINNDWGDRVLAEDVLFENAEKEEACRQQTTDLIRTYLGQVPTDEPRPSAVESILETPLVDPQSGEDLGIPLLGVVDLVLPEASGPRIIDFKTAAKGGELLEIVHEIQLTSYAYLFRATAPQHEADLEIRSLIKTKTPKVEYHRYVAREAHHFQRLFAVVRAYLDDLDCGRFVFRPQPWCGSCEFVDSGCQSSAPRSTY